MLQFIKIEEDQHVHDDKPEPLANASLDELNELGEDDEFADDDFLEKYRQARLDELKQQALTKRFGQVLDISKGQWVREVTEASKDCTVIVHLFNDSMVECALMDEALVVIADKFKEIKICRIRSTTAVENWPDSNLPTLFIYKNSELFVQSLTLANMYGKSMKPIDLEWWLVTRDVIGTSDLEEDPRDAER